MKKLTLTIITLTSLMIGSVSLANGSDCPYRANDGIKSENKPNYANLLPRGLDSAPSVSPTQTTPVVVKSTGG